jgi:ribonuclease P protein component
VSRQVKGAVSRNRARRRLREAARLVLLADGWESAEGGITYDVVLIARPATLAISFDQLTREIAAVRDRLAAP